MLAGESLYFTAPLPLCLDGGCTSEIYGTSGDEKTQQIFRVYNYISVISWAAGIALWASLLIAENLIFGVMMEYLLSDILLTITVCLMIIPNKWSFFFCYIKRYVLTVLWFYLVFENTWGREYPQDRLWVTNVRTSASCMFWFTGFLHVLFGEITSF